MTGHGNIHDRSRGEEDVPWFPARNVEENRFRQNMNTPSLPSYCLLLLFLTGFVLYGVIIAISNVLPTPLSIQDAASNPDQFIEERALNNLRHLVSLGPKVVGSYENEVLAVDFLTREVNFIIQQALPIYNISLDLQRTTGSYFLDFKNAGFINYYSNIQNIVVKFSSNKNSSNSLLINCHFDSVPESPGGSDDGLNCAAMLEVLRVLSRSNSPLVHDVIFLFNGAEENPLQASHGFITQHRWASEIRAFINLEACGAGGREVLFQAGPNHPWLVEMYADSVPHPHGLVLAEDIFQSGLVPSDTDFRVFRQFGQIPGLDFAHAMNGYVYHTRHDDLPAIPAGTLQHTGDNLLALTRRIASSSELATPEHHSKGRAVYYDILGLYMVCYSELTGTVLNLFAILLSVSTAIYNVKTIADQSRTSFLWKFLLGCGVPLMGWLVGIFSAVLVATLVDLAGSSLSYYSRPYLIFGLYYCPTLLGNMVFIVLLDRCKSYQKLALNPSLQAQLYTNCVQLLWSVLLLVATVSGIRSSFVFLVVVLVPTLNSLLLSSLQLQKSTQTWLCTYLIGTAVPIIFILYQTKLAFGLFVPITGRMGSTSNPDQLIGVLAAILCILTTSYLTPLIVLVRSRWKVLVGLAAMLLISLVAIITTPLGFPFSADPMAPSPQRILVFHTERMFHDDTGQVRHNDSGYWLVPLDRRGPGSVRDFVPEVTTARSMASDCDTEMLCGLPAYSTRLLPLCKYSYWIDAPQPVIQNHNPTSIQVMSRKMTLVNTRRIAFQVKGPDHMGVYICPRSGVRLVGWSFDHETPKETMRWEGRAAYYIHYSYGSLVGPFDFWLDLEVTPDWNLSTLDMGLAGHYLTASPNKSPQFEVFLSQYPPWAHITAWTASYKSYQF